MTVDPALVEWVARRTLLMHTEPPAEGRKTGRCTACPADPDTVCPVLVLSISYLRRIG